MEVIIYFGVGIATGIVLHMVIYRIKSVGVLRVDNSDPDDGPYLFLELSKDIGCIKRKKYVVLKVNLKSCISHK